MTKQSIATQGQSISTEFKERGLEAAFSINLKIFNKKFGSKYPYWHFDLNCGTGFNEKIGCIGSPIAFLNASGKFPDVKTFAGFCDKNHEALSSLHDHVQERRNCFFFHGDNSSLIEAIPNIVASYDNPKKALGTVLSDPNGFETPITELAWLSEQCPGLDLIIHWNSRIRRLYRGQGWEFVDIDDAIARMNKKHWLIRQPMGAHQWTVLIGRNIRIGDHRSLGFHHLDSKRGQHILASCKARIEKIDPQMRIDL